MNEFTKKELAYVGKTFVFKGTSYKCVQVIRMYWEKEEPLALVQRVDDDECFPLSECTVLEITKKQVRVSTSDFVLSHGKAPRGIGGWAFYFPQHQTTEWAPRGTYTASKKWAINRAVELGTTLVEVGS
tara:strand:+ start:1123 stop:1509 length:387 start_codon:yes stop_codon:yes gene_type:complete